MINPKKNGTLFHLYIANWISCYYFFVLSFKKWFSFLDSLCFVFCYVKLACDVEGSSYPYRAAERCCEQVVNKMFLTSIFLHSSIELNKINRQWVKESRGVSALYEKDSNKKKKTHTSFFNSNENEEKYCN